ncbi:MAG: NAD(P)-dependent oxidoreductase [Thermonemataceae bacterium]
MKIGIIREGKVPVDKRVVLLPAACQEAKARFPTIEIIVQTSIIRCVKDEAYRQAGFPINESMKRCDVLLGVKEVPIKDLIPHNTYMFYSHTIKKQPYNRQLLRAILEKNITLIDYECLTDAQGNRIIAFGRYAGIVGAYNAFWTYGKRYDLYDLHRAIDCEDYDDLLKGLQTAYPHLPPHLKVVLTGRGRSGGGAAEMLEGMGIKKVSPEAYLSESFNQPVYTHLASSDYYQPIQSQAPSFYEAPEKYQSDFLKFAKQSDIFISAHYWNPKAARLFTKEDVRLEDFRLRIIADITCDIDGSVPTTIRASTIADPVYDYNPTTEQDELAFSEEQNITVMAVDNLPCELPIGASRSFGNQFIQEVLPHFFNGDPAQVLASATIAKAGKLTPSFHYLQDFVDGKV